MKRYLLIIIAFIPLNWIVAQNLVLNPSFEDIRRCPFSLNQLHYADYWTSPLPTNFSTPDLFHSCSNSSLVSVPTNVLGSQEAHLGESYAGIVTLVLSRIDTIGCAYDSSLNYREYLQGEFVTKLIAGKNYAVSMWLSAADTSNFAVPNLGVYFSKTRIGPHPGTFHPLPYTPQLKNTTLSLANTTTWEKVEWVYQATGGEQYMLIGNFDSDSQSTASYINCYSDFISFSSYYYIDDVRVVDTVLYSLPEDYKGMPEAFTPNGDMRNDYYKPVGLVDESVINFTIYNSWGQKIYERKESPFEGWNGRYKDVEQPKGVYLYVLTYKLAEKKESVRKGYFTLIR